MRVISKNELKYITILQDRLIICGAGYVSLALIRIGKMLGFHVVVIEDRPSFAGKAEEAGADEVICEAFREALYREEGSRQTYFVIVTRGHRHDMDCLKAILEKKEYAYVGMMGSKGRVKRIREQLREEGFLQSMIDELNSPIGLSIGAVTPEEIAVSIAAELVTVRNGIKSKSKVNNEAIQKSNASLKADDEIQKSNVSLKIDGEIQKSNVSLKIDGEIQKSNVSLKIDGEIQKSNVSLKIDEERENNENRKCNETGEYIGFTREILEAAVEESEIRRVLATIVSRRGSAPREEGTRMVIFADGRTVGTIGGGCMEGEVIRRAATEMRQTEHEEESVFMEIKLLEEEIFSPEAEENKMACGGIIEVEFVEIK